MSNGLQFCSMYNTSLIVNDNFAQQFIERAKFLKTSNRCREVFVRFIKVYQKFSQTFDGAWYFRRWQCLRHFSSSGGNCCRLAAAGGLREVDVSPRLSSIRTSTTPSLSQSRLCFLKFLHLNRQDSRNQTQKDIFWVIHSI